MNRKIRLGILAFIALFSFLEIKAQCGFTPTCSSSDYLNYGMGSSTNATSLEYDNFISTFHSTAVRTSSGVYKVWGEDMANNGTGDLLAPTIIDNTTFTALTGTVLKVAMGSSSINNAQGILLATDGLYAWSTEGAVIAASITTSSTFQKLTINGNTQGLPTGINPTDVKMMFATYRALAIVTCSGSVYVISRRAENTGQGTTGNITGAAGAQWYQVTEATGGNPFISNVIQIRGNRNTMFALKSDGTLWTWGTETYLGDGSAPAVRTRATQMTLPSANPIKMIGATRHDATSGSSYFVLNANGNLYALGENSNKQLGDWSTLDKNIWVQPRYTSAAGPIMNNIHWISAQEHDDQFGCVNVLTSDSTNYNWGNANGQMLGRGGAGDFDPGIPGGILVTDKILAVETGGHTSMLAKKCEDYFGYVGHRINGSMGDGTAASTNEVSYSFATAIVYICGASTVTVEVSGTPTLSPGGLYCNGTSTDLLPYPTGGTLTILSGPATLSGTIITFTGSGNTSVNVQYAMTFPGCPTAKVATTTLLTEDCTLPTVTLSGTTSIAENAAGVATLTATMSAAAVTSTTITITYTGTASGTDYAASSVTIVIPAGSTSGTVTIDPTNDATFEGSETVIADITGVTSASGVTENGTQTATVTITDDETSTVTLTGTTSIAENAAGTVTLTATLSVASPTSTTVTITYTGTASGSDYAASSTTIVIPAGSTTGTVTIDPTNDGTYEGSETVIADITGVTSASGVTENGTQTATVTITDDEAVPTVTLSGTTSIAENAAGTVTLTATLSVPTTVATTITLTYSGTAVGADYAASSTTIIIPAGSTTGTVTIDPTNDATFEGSETVIADITGVAGGNGASESGTQTATVTITDDEAAPTVTLTGTTSIAENAPGVATLTATLSGTSPTSTTVTITYTGTTVAGDYTASSTTIVIPAGSLTGTVTIDPTNDGTYEGSETVIADITGVTSASGVTENGTQTATVTITDDEVIPTVTLTGTTSIAENAAGVATLTATLSVPTTVATTVTVAYTGTAVGADYSASSTTIVIPAGSTTGTVTIDPTNDGTYEGSETVIANITAVAGGNGATESGTQTATVTITDDEVAPTVTLTGTTSIAENAAGVATLTATLSVPTTVATTVTVAYTGTAVGADYAAGSTTIVIPAGSTTGTVTIDPTDDAIFEGSETVITDITAVAGGNGATESGTQTATVTITDDEAAPTVSLSGTTSIAENAAGVATLTATLSAATATSTTVTLTYTGTAAGADYVASSVTIVIAAGSTTGTVTIDPTNDGTYEGSETVIADITGVTSASGVTENGTQTATVTITDDEVAPTVTLTGTTSIAENAAGVATLTATLSVPTTVATTVTVAYTGTAVGADYAASSTTIVIPAGSTTGTVTIDPTNDGTYEGSETVIADITAVAGGNGASESGTQTATVTITDDEAAPTVTLTGTTSIAENAAGVATLTATLSVPTTVATTVTVTYTGTAVGADYSASSTTIIIPAGSTTGTVTIDPTNDGTYEGSETVITNITAVAGGNGATENGTQTATVTITDDETVPTVTLTGTTTIAENAAGVATLTATLSVPTTVATTVTLTYSGTAVGADYAASSTTIIIPAGSTTGTVTIDPTNDGTFEGSETVIANITAVAGGNGATESGTQTATVTITDDEAAPTVTLTGTASIAENAAGTVTLTATLSSATATSTTVTLTYTGTAGAGDYAASSTTIVIPAGSTTGTVTIDPTNDGTYEGSETVIADITAVAGGNGATESGTQTATVTITDDETIPTVTLSGTISIAENAAGVATLTATLSVPTTVATTVTLTYSGTAVGADYAASSTTIIIPAGSTTGTVTIDPTNDGTFEGSETVIANITAVAGGNGATESGTQTATVTITDDETIPTVTLSGTISIAENAAGVATLTATLSVPTTVATTVTLTYSGTAVGADYAASSTTIIIPAGSTTGTVTIDPTNDVTFEGSETVIANITAVAGGNGATESGTQTATVTITDDETIPTVTLTGTTSIAENAAGVATLTATLSTPTTVATTVTLTYTGTATSGTDYVASSVTIVIPAGSTTGTVTIDPTNDATFEGSETVIANITGVAGGNGATELGTQTATVTITDANIPPVAIDNSNTTNEDIPVVLSSIQTNDTDADGSVVVGTIDLDPLTAGQQTSFTNTQGTWVVNTTSGDVTFTPALNYNGTATIQYTINDNGGSTSNTANLSVSVNPINDTLGQGNEIMVVFENTLSTTSPNLTTNNIDPDGTTTTVTTILSSTAGGTTIITGGGTTIDYTPLQNYVGIDTVIYTVCDAGLPLPAICLNDTLFITVSPITDTIPFTIPEDSTITICADSLTDFGTAATSITTCNTPNNGTILISGTCITYTPNANFNGIDSLCVVSCNGLICDTSIVIINVTPINDPPIVNDTLTTTPEDSPITICLTIADADLSQTYITSSCGNPINGTTSTSVTGNQLCVTYTPNPNFNGLDSLCLVVCDNGTPSLCDTTNIVINVTPVNDAPVITDVNTTVAAGTIVPINVAAGTSDPDGDALTYTYGASTGVPVVVTVTGNGTIVVAPVNPTDTGLVVIPVTVCDNGTPVLCDNGTITIHFVPDSVLTNTNFAPIAVNDLASTNPNTPVTVNIKGNDSDPNGNNTIGTPTIFINPTNGVAVINPDGTLTYTPNNGFTGNDTLTYVVCDNGTPSLCDTALVVVSVINGVIPNQPPVATDDYPSVTEDVPVVIGVKNNDSDPDGNVLGNPTIITNPTNGTAVVNGDGTVTYTPNPNYNGPDTLTYVVCDNGTPSLCDTAVVVINVTPANDAPVITDVTTTVAAGTIVPVNIAAGTSDPDGDALTYTYGASTGVPVVVTVTGNGTIVVNPVNPSDTGLVVIPVTVCDNGSPVLCDNGTITIHFVPDSVLANTNFAPIAVNDLASTNPNTPVTVNIKGNDSDPNGNNTLGTPSIFINPTNGTASINPDGTLTYTPNNGFTGNDTLTYVVCDNGTPSLCDTALVVVSVINGVIPNQPPVATDDYPTTTEDVPVVIGVKNNDSDPDGNVLGNPTIITNPTNGTAVVNIDGTITYTPNPNFHGNDTLVYVVCDNGTPSLCDTANVIITIDPANDAPVITDVTTTVAAGTTVPVNIAAGTSDPNGDLLTYTYGASTGVPVVVTVTGNGTIVVTPVNATDTGLVVIPVTVCDNGTPVLCDNGTITIHFVPDSVLVNTNFPPVALNDLTNTNPNTPVTVNIKGNDSDPNGNNTIGAPSIFINPTNGAAVINPDGTLTYTPNNGFIGNDTLTYIICDNGTPSLCDTAIVVVSVTETVIVNHPPVATDDYPTVTEDTPTIVIVKSNDSDPDGNVLGNPTIITNPANGTAVVNIDGTITYTPNPNFNGIDTLTYVICDNGIPSLCDTANVIININSINDEPIINDTTVVTPQGTPITVCLPISDLDAGQTYFYSSCGNPVNGTVTSTIVGNTVCLTYTPNNGYTGLDSMCVVVCDNGSPSLCDTATIVVNVTPGPVVVNENVGGTTGSPITGNILTNDSPVGATIGSTVDNPNNGTITITPGTGGFTYTPNPGFSGYDTVIVEVCSNSICVNDTIFITVNPDINNETITVTSGTSSTGTIGTNDNGTGLTYGTTPVSGPNHGTITIGATGTYTYTPTNGYTGPDTVVVTVCDSSVPPLCSTDTIFVNIIDGPTVVNENVGGTTGSPITGNILTNDSPVGATIGSTVDNPNNGTITITPGTGGFTYTPNPGFSGYDTVIVQVCANSACINDTIFITVNPDINNETITVTSSTSSTGTIGTNDNGTGLTYGTTPVSGPNHGTITVGPTGTYTYTPNNGYTGPDTVIVAVCDASTPALCTTDTIFINVITGPIVTNENAGGVTGTPITGNVLTNDGPTGSTLGNIVDTPHNGTAVVNPNGGFTYTPNTGFSGRDTVVVEVCFNGACVNDTIFITVYPNIIDESISVNAGSTTTGSIGTNDSGTGLTYGTTPVTGPTNGTIVLNTNGTYTYTANSGYTGFDTVVVTVCDASVPALCSTDTIFITINEVVTGIVIPKGFSPNGDGINDNLEIKGIENFPDNNMKIFNRWGSIIYEADHYDNTSVKWEGTSTGKMVIGDEKAPEATYFYILVYKDAKGEEQKMVGYIYLNRNGQ